MAEVTPHGVSGNRLTRATIAEMLAKNLERLPVPEQGLMLYGPLCLGGTAGLAGVISNMLHRGALNVTQARVASSLPMAVLPFLATYAMYNAAVLGPLMHGDLNCPSCALLRGALVGGVLGGVYPVLLALPVNIGLATTYNTAPMPEKGNVLWYMVDLSRSILRRMRAMMVLQALFGTYLSYRHSETYTKLVQLAFSSEELED